MLLRFRGWLWPLVGGRTLRVLHAGVPLCMAVVGSSLLVVGRAGGQMEVLSAVGPCVYLWAKILVGLSVGSGGNWGILVGLMIKPTRTD